MTEGKEAQTFQSTFILDAITRPVGDADTSFDPAEHRCTHRDKYSLRSTQKEAAVTSFTLNAFSRSKHVHEASAFLSTPLIH